MDQSRRVVETNWRSRMVNVVTSDKNKAAPVYKREKISELHRTSPAGVVSAVVEHKAVHSPSLDSHFISLPLAIHPGLIKKLNNFQNCILGEANSSQGRSSTLSDMGIEKSIFIKPNTLHLTVLMLKLWNEERIAAATDVLQGVYPKVLHVLDHRPISIKLGGLECMRGSHANAQIVYAPVEEVGGEGRLLRACNVIIQAYIEAGLVLETDVRRPLKLHVTLMNARFRNRKSSIRRNDFDARDIFSRFGSEKWGDYLIREAHLSQRFRYDEGGYYHCCASIPFSTNTQIRTN